MHGITSLYWQVQSLHHEMRVLYLQILQRPENLVLLASEVADDSGTQLGRKRSSAAPCHADFQAQLLSIALYVGWCKHIAPIWGNWEFCTWLQPMLRLLCESYSVRFTLRMASQCLPLETQELLMNSIGTRGIALGCLASPSCVMPQAHGSCSVIGRSQLFAAHAAHPP